VRRRKKSSKTLISERNEDFFDSGKLMLSAAITDSFLHHLDHPSDVPGLIPPSVRRALNHFFKPRDVFVSLDLDGEDEDGPGEFDHCHALAVEPTVSLHTLITTEKCQYF
jgi:hypothetical protein